MLALPVKRIFQFKACTYNLTCLHFFRFMYGLVFPQKVQQTFAFSKKIWIASATYQNILSRFLLSFVHRKYPTGHRFMFAFQRTPFFFIFLSVAVLYPFHSRSVCVLYPFDIRSVPIPFPFSYLFCIRSVPVLVRVPCSVSSDRYCILASPKSESKYK